MVSYQSLPNIAIAAKIFWFFLHAVLFATLASQPKGVIFVILFSEDKEFITELNILVVVFVITVFFYFYTGYVGTSHPNN
jgi:hypothetical protein